MMKTVMVIGWGTPWVGSAYFVAENLEGVLVAKKLTVSYRGSASPYIVKYHTGKGDWNDAPPVLPAGKGTVYAQVFSSNQPISAVIYKTFTK